MNNRVRSKTMGGGKNVTSSDEGSTTLKGFISCIWDIISGLNKKLWLLKLHIKTYFLHFQFESVIP